MTSEDLRAELEKHPFSPVKLHLVSGKTVDVPRAESAWLLQNAIMVFQNPRAHGRYDLLALRNIERVEQLPTEGEGE